MDILFLWAAVGACLLIPRWINRRHHNKNAVEFRNYKRILTSDEINEAITSVTAQYRNSEKQYDYVYTTENMPLGRASAFLNYHGTNCWVAEPYLFLCKRSLKDNEFREYGCIVSSNGLYFSEDNPKNAKRKEKQAALQGKDYQIPFTGLVKVKTRRKKICVTYIDLDRKRNITRKIKIENKYEREFFSKILRCVVDQGFGFAMMKGCIIETIEEIPQALEQVFGGMEEARNYYLEKKSKAEKQINQTGFDVGLSAAAAQAVQPQFNAFYAENKNYMNGSRGHGYAAEYGNNAVDRFFAREVENAAQQLVNGRQAKYGADRIVDGVEIQTKYCQSAPETIGQAFARKEAVYIRSDGSEKMMAIEVPRDQFKEAVELMQKRIDKGQVPNVEPGESAKDYVRKGYFTYDQAYLIAQSGTIESLTVDALSGAVCCSQAAGITATISFALAIWNGQSAKDAFKQSMAVGLKVLGQGTLIYTVTMQLSRGSIANIFAGKNTVHGTVRGYHTIENPVFTFSENMAAKIHNSGLAKSPLGKSMGAESVTGRQLIGVAVTAAFVFGPDIARMMVGRISVKQLVKNTVIAGSGMAGAALGQALIPVPVLGAIAGGAAASFIAKKGLDRLVEDDAKEMFRILKEEFLDTTMLVGLSETELRNVVNLTIGDKKLGKQLQKMYQSQAYRSYAREAIMLPAIRLELMKRKNIAEEDYRKELVAFAAGD